MNKLVAFVIECVSNFRVALPNFSRHSPRIAPGDHVSSKREHGSEKLDPIQSYVLSKDKPPMA